MAHILTFPFRKENNERLTRIETDRAQAELDVYNAMLDAEVAGIHAKLDQEIYGKHGSMESYGRYIINKKLPWASLHTTWGG